VNRITKILCPVDRSPISRRALDYAAGLCRSFGAQLQVLEVGPSGQTAHQRQEASEELERFAESVRLGGVTPVVTMAEGNVPVEILLTAEASQADLIVMGTHGHGGFERFMLGSVTERVLRKASCPVLAIPPGDRTPAHVMFRTVVCGVDFAPASIRGIDYAQLLTAKGGRLILVHAVGWPFGEGTEQMPPEIDALRRSLEADALGRLQRAAAAGRSDIYLQEAVGIGKPYALILRHAREAAADLIVMGLHSHAANQLALLGSSTRHVLHDAPCPVLTVSDRQADGS
jgi:nucleotide-binding universal stress UspA family protein